MSEATLIIIDRCLLGTLINDQLFTDGIRVTHYRNVCFDPSSEVEALAKFDTFKINSDLSSQKAVEKCIVSDWLQSFYSKYCFFMGCKCDSFWQICGNHITVNTHRIQQCRPRVGNTSGLVQAAEIKTWERIELNVNTYSSVFSEETNGHEQQDCTSDQIPLEEALKYPICAAFKPGPITYDSNSVGVNRS